MARELIWSRAALDDLDAIASWVGRDSPNQARRIIEGVFETCEWLLTQPEPAAIWWSSKPVSVMQYETQGLRILFERQGEDLHLLAIAHGGRRDPL